MKNYHELKVWEKSHLLTLETYKITKPSQKLNYLELQVKFDDHVFQYLRILQKVVGETVMLSFQGF